MFEIKPWENQNLVVQIFELTRTILTTIGFCNWDRFPMFYASAILQLQEDRALYREPLS